VALPFYTKKNISRQKKNYENSNISQHAKILILKKSSKPNQNPSRYYYNSVTNLKFQHKPKYCFSKRQCLNSHLFLVKNSLPFFHPKRGRTQVWGSVVNQGTTREVAHRSN
jgi:hypothetical protein